MRSLSSRAEVLAALKKVTDGSVLRINMKEVKLKKTIAITASNVVILGKKHVTKVRCPPEGDAFFVR